MASISVCQYIILCCVPSSYHMGGQVVGEYLLGSASTSHLGLAGSLVEIVVIMYPTSPLPPHSHLTPTPLPPHSHPTPTSLTTSLPTSLPPHYPPHYPPHSHLTPTSLPPQSHLTPTSLPTSIPPHYPPQSHLTPTSLPPPTSLPTSLPPQSSLCLHSKQTCTHFSISNALPLG